MRDPKVFAYEGRYYMVLGARTVDDRGEVLVLESTDRLHWSHINTLAPPAWDCKTLPVQNIFAWNVHFLPNVTF